MPTTYVSCGVSRRDLDKHRGISDGATTVLQGEGGVLLAAIVAWGLGYSASCDLLAAGAVGCPSPMRSRANAEQPIVLDHLGTPWLETTADQAAWNSGMRECARRENICVKISGLWPLDRAWRPDRIAAPVRLVVDLFGPGRCLWASNYPVEKLMCPVLDQIGNLEEVLHDLSEDEKDMIFRRTARRVYRMA